MKKNETKISFNCPNDVLERIEKLAKKADMDRTRLIVNMIDETSKSMELSGKVGLLQFSMLIRNMGEYMEKWATKMKDKKIDLI
jgi:hypothetical protein